MLSECNDLHAYASHFSKKKVIDLCEKVHLFTLFYTWKLDGWNGCMAHQVSLFFRIQKKIFQVWQIIAKQKKNSKMTDWVAFNECKTKRKREKQHICLVNIFKLILKFCWQWCDLCVVCYDFDYPSPCYSFMQSLTICLGLICKSRFNNSNEKHLVCAVQCSMHVYMLKIKLFYYFKWKHQ